MLQTPGSSARFAKSQKRLEKKNGEKAGDDAKLSVSGDHKRAKIKKERRGGFRGRGWIEARWGVQARTRGAEVSLVETLGRICVAF